VASEGLTVGEFELIERFFTRPTPKADLGVGDDCALLSVAPDMQLAVSSDMLVSGRHFLADAEPGALGHKALAVNLSDLAACGARPIAFTLALALPDAHSQWLQPFATQMLALADAHGCELIGGDTTRGPLTICITVFGEVPRGQALLRGGAQPHDDIYVSGTLGDARLALEARLGKVDLPQAMLSAANLRMDQPTARVALGLALRGVASAAVDVSDGLLGDLGHILKRSGVGATIYTSDARKLLALQSPRVPEALALSCVLAGGDDYELVFTAAPHKRAAVESAARASQTPVTRIGRIDAQPGLRLLDAHGAPVPDTFASFDHFSS
jgi:thiamine-monophosphate kinase